MGAKGGGLYVPNVQAFQVLDTRECYICLAIFKGGGANVYESTIQSGSLRFVDSNCIGEF